MKDHFAEAQQSCNSPFSCFLYGETEQQNYSRATSTTTATQAQPQTQFSNRSSVQRQKLQRP